MYLVSVGVVCLVLVHIVFCCLATSGSVRFFFLPPLPTQRKGPRELEGDNSRKYRMHVSSHIWFRSVDYEREPEGHKIIWVERCLTRSPPTTLLQARPASKCGPRQKWQNLSYYGFHNDYKNRTKDLEFWMRIVWFYLLFDRWLFCNFALARSELFESRSY